MTLREGKLTVIEGGGGTQSSLTFRESLSLLLTSSELLLLSAKHCLPFCKIIVQALEVSLRWFYELAIKNLHWTAILVRINESATLMRRFCILLITNKELET